MQSLKIPAIVLIVLAFLLSFTLGYSYAVNRLPRPTVKDPFTRYIVGIDNPLYKLGEVEGREAEIRQRNVEIAQEIVATIPQEHYRGTLADNKLNVFLTPQFVIDVDETGLELLKQHPKVLSVGKNKAAFPTSN